ncbi:uncharacterized protein LOC116351029 [Contarinia nasturtii]|uniref:uncharacterized protein LOC116351029 n=1 Tax=Contarinia nasturtii TaxID=265458 RepID=UPI0012D4135C|nr:uncharacterized protein LOC116351029 [Contarinia nasturtii]
MEIMKYQMASKIIFVLLTSIIMRVCSRILPESSSVDIVFIAPAEHQVNFLPFTGNFDAVHTNSHNRQKRAAYDPYDAYYFYPKSLNQQRPSTYDRPDADDSFINRRDTDDSNRIEGKNVQKYKYTPLFQYKSTQSRRRKLFVPNLFG